jgi:hypothetical protein
MKNVVKNPAKVTRKANAKANAKAKATNKTLKVAKKSNGVHSAKLKTNKSWKEQRGSITFCLKAVCENDQNFLKAVNKEYKLNLTKTTLKGNNELMSKLVALRTEREQTFKGFTPWLVMSLIVRYGKANVEATK